MARILFLDDGKPFNGSTIRAGPVGGIQHATVSLAEAFARSGQSVTVYNKMPHSDEVNGVKWFPLGSFGEADADMIVTSNNARAFGKLGRRTKVVWYHNPLVVHRQFKRGNIAAIFRHRPHGVFLGRYHVETASKLLPLASRHTIGYGHSPEFVRQDEASAAPPQRAIFFSQAYRGLKYVLEVWTKHVWPRVSRAELHLVTGDPADIRLEDYARFGVVRRERMPRAKLAKELADFRVMLCPGHWHETYCSAAAEATLAGVPIVSCGIGSLSERVQHEVNGCIASTQQTFGQYAVDLLSDDHRWMQLHRGAMRTRDLTTWDDRAAQWVRTFLN